MVSKSVYDSFPDEEKRLWQLNKYEVKSGMLILPKPEGVDNKERRRRICRP